MLLELLFKARTLTKLCSRIVICPLKAYPLSGRKREQTSDSDAIALAAVALLLEEERRAK
jgi:hypothetical protein